MRSFHSVSASSSSYIAPNVTIAKKRRKKNVAITQPVQETVLTPKPRPEPRKQSLKSIYVATPLATVNNRARIPPKIQLKGQTSEAVRIQTLRCKVMIALHKIVPRHLPLSYVFSHDLKPQLLRMLEAHGSDVAFATFKWRCSTCAGLDAQLSAAQQLLATENAVLMVESTIVGLLHVMTSYHNLIWTHVWEECADMIEPTILLPGVYEEEESLKVLEEKEKEIHLFFGPSPPEEPPTTALSPSAAYHFYE